MSTLNKENLPTPEPSSDMDMLFDKRAFAAPTRRPAYPPSPERSSSPARPALHKRERGIDVDLPAPVRHRQAGIHSLATPPPTSSPHLAARVLPQLDASSPPRPIYDASSLPPSSPPPAADTNINLNASTTTPPRRKNLLTSPLRVRQLLHTETDAHPPPRPLLFASPTRTIILGRARPGSSTFPPHNPINLPPSPSSPRPLRHYKLPSRAAHVSRVHLAISFRPDECVFRLVVLGQNGVRIAGEKFRRGDVALVGRRRAGGLEVRKEGEDGVLAVVEEEDEVELDFFDEQVKLHWPPELPDLSAVDDNEEMDDASSSSSSSSASDSDDSPSSSPIPFSLKRAAHSRSPAPAPKKSRPTTPAPAPAYHYDSEEEHDPFIASSPAPPPSSPPPPADAPLPTHPDLPGLLANTLTFSPTTLTPISDILAALLTTNPALADEAPRAAWHVVVECTLRESGEMFGRVERTGKDAAGAPLQDLFFYNPAHDPDAARAANLGSMVRLPRGAARAGSTKQVFWKPIKGGSRRR